ncbi:MAG: hypothetical protein ACHQ5A_01920 [Opitutales bacterium]
MISNSGRIVGAVEIGTGKIAVLVGEIARGRALNIIGVGLAQSRGVMKGEVVDYKTVCEATHHALETAEKKAGARIDGSGSPRPAGTSTASTTRPRST